MRHDWGVRRRFVVAWVAAVVALGAAPLPACSGGGRSSTIGTPPAPTDATSTTSTTRSRFSETDHRTLNAVVYFAGFRLTVVSAELDPAVSRLTVAVALYNMGTTTGTLDASVSVRAGNEAQTGALRTIDPVEPGGSAATSFTTKVSVDFDLGPAFLTIGRSDHVQAMVPLGGRDQKGLVALAPQAIPARGALQVGPLTLTVTQAELRADQPELHLEADAGSRFVIVHVDATASAPAAFTWETARLRGQGGVDVAATSGSIRLVSPNSPAAALVVAFPVSDRLDPTGLSLVYSSGGSRGSVAFS